MNAILTISALSDNYIYLMPVANGFVAIDPSDASPVQKALEKANAELAGILVTHHHSDHTGGVRQLVRSRGCKVYGPVTGGALVRDGETLTVGGTDIQVIATPGHTRDHVCYHVPSLQSVFTGDTLFVAGCGRLFEGSAGEMWSSLRRLSQLPADTLVYCGHEYTEENLRFALSLEPGNSLLKERLSAARSQLQNGKPTVPSTIAIERQTNPFLRAGDPSLRQALGLPSAADWEVFGEARRRKDRF